MRSRGRMAEPIQRPRAAISAFTMLAMGTLTKATGTLQCTPATAVAMAPEMARTDTAAALHCARRSAWACWVRSAASVLWRCACSASAMRMMRSAPLATMPSNSRSTAGGGSGPRHSAETSAPLASGLALRAAVLGVGFFDCDTEIPANAAPVVAHPLDVGCELGAPPVGLPGRQQPIKEGRPERWARRAFVCAHDGDGNGAGKALTTCRGSRFAFIC